MYLWNSSVLSLFVYFIVLYVLVVLSLCSYVFISLCVCLFIYFVRSLFLEFVVISHFRYFVI